MRKPSKDIEQDDINEKAPIGIESFQELESMNLFRESARQEITK